MKPEEIITDAEVDHVHANANFGSTPKRDVIAFGLLQSACGFSTGHTCRCILEDHGLVGRARTRGRKPVAVLTKKGRDYLWAAFGRQSF